MSCWRSWSRSCWRRSRAPFSLLSWSQARRSSSVRGFEGIDISEYAIPIRHWCIEETGPTTGGDADRGAATPGTARGLVGQLMRVWPLAA